MPYENPITLQLSLQAAFGNWKCSPLLPIQIPSTDIAAIVLDATYLEINLHWQIVLLIQSIEIDIFNTLFLYRFLRTDSCILFI